MARVSSSPGRRVTLVLCTREGIVLGALPPYDVASPWWQDVREVVAAARIAYGVEVTVLRLLNAEADRPSGGGPVVYLAQVSESPALRLARWLGDPLAPEPLRQRWARPGGPDADLGWADGVLDERGTPRTGPPEQLRTWNLSSLWRLPTSVGAIWLKAVPAFLADEGAILPRLDPAVVPPLVAAAGRRVLLSDVAGVDLYDASTAQLLLMVRMLVAVQAQWSSRIDELHDLELPVWSAAALGSSASDTLAASAGELDAATRRDIDALVTGLEGRYAEVASCGVPDSLVHGDFHPGNVRGTSDRLVILDWADCAVGPALLDQSAFVERLSEDDRAVVRAAWADLWRAAVPGSHPLRAAQLLEPVAALRRAVIYRRFLDAIEPDERAYHAGDPARWLRHAARAAGATSRSPPR